MLRLARFFLVTFGLVIALLAGCGTPAVKSAAVHAETWKEFDAKLECLRQQKIPGMSAGVVMDQKLAPAFPPMAGPPPPDHPIRG